MGRRNTLRKPTRDEILQEYSKPSSTISGVAKIFDTSNATLRKWMIEFGIDRKSHAEALREVKTSHYVKCPDVDTLVCMVNDGSSLAMIRKYFDVTVAQMNEWMSYHNLSTSKNKYMEKDIPSQEELEVIVKSNMTYQSMCDELEISYPTLMKWLDVYGLRRDDKKKYETMNEAVSTKKLERYGYLHFPESVYENYSASTAELELREYVKSFIPDFKRHFINDDKGDRLELDMYSESKGIGIEYSGAYWHSELFKDKNYHYDKWKAARNTGIDLMTFWDLEFKEREEQIKAFIRARLGVFKERIYARNLEFKEISYSLKDFFEQNHIQGGKARIERNFGLLQGDRIVGAVSYSTHHRDNTKYTLNRMCFESDVQVIGGVSKLLSNSLSIVDRDVITWSDNRFSNGNVYLNNGFEFECDLSPDYSYFDKKGKILPKQSQRKSLTGCPDNVTEHEFCLSLGRYRLWDCGKKRFIARRK